MIYLDHNASTPVDPAVKDAMLPFLTGEFGNPSSTHARGAPLRRAVEHARGQVAELLACAPDEVVFTSGGTESNNMVIKGVAHTLRARGNHIIISAVEHPAVVNPCRYLTAYGFDITHVPVDRHGLVDAQEIAAEVRPGTILISVMHANNEVGTIQPIEEIAQLARQGGIWFHSDAAQSCGKISTRVYDLGVDFLTIAGHKMYAPHGIGALFIRNGISIEPLMHGAGHEGGRRAGTEPVANIVGLGKAAELARMHLPHASRTAALRDELLDGLKKSWGDDAVLLGHPTLRLPNTVSVGFRGRIGAELLAACPEVCASTGAACHATARKRSSTLAAMGVPEETAFGAIRFSLGQGTTASDIQQTTGLFARIRSPQTARL